MKEFFRYLTFGSTAYVSTLAASLLLCWVPAYLVICGWNVTAVAVGVLTAFANDAVCFGKSKK